MTQGAQKNDADTFFGLPSAWRQAFEFSQLGITGRFESEIADLVVFGEIPKELNGTFYRMMVDPLYPLMPDNPAIEGDGNICALRIQDGRVNMKNKYIETERLKLEKQANKRLFGLYRNPFTHHPCVRAAIDSTANTNVIYWAGRLLTLKEVAQPYEIHPDTLQTLGSDPLAFPANYIILVLWPFEAQLDRIESGGQHWLFSYDRPATFIAVPRRPDNLPAGWSKGESRVYHWENSVAIHTAGSWEGEDGKLYFESSRVFYNTLPWFEPPGEPDMRDLKADYVRWEIDINQPTGTKVKDPEIILDLPSEFARMDERFLTRTYDRMFVPVLLPHRPNTAPPVVPLCLNGYVMLEKGSNRRTFFDPGPYAAAEEPIFVPRSESATEGDGWVLAMVQRTDVNRSDLIVLDTRHFEKPVAVIQLPFRTKNQIHFNWVDNKERNDQVLPLVG
ncbi:isoeugenol monooxygenase [Fusarium napiforme]|uniref:Isoeugenol monooxygenase n=1 Tax=Fusarium napiforme TaxID=42672 RepID=A0A8H5IU22_9HYPO|nr:isoeugenol monooxygenase [Fusarium napiforme]